MPKGIYTRPARFAPRKKTQIANPQQDQLGKVLADKEINWTSMYYEEKDRANNFESRFRKVENQNVHLCRAIFHLGQALNAD